MLYRTLPSKARRRKFKFTSTGKSPGEDTSRKPKQKADIVYDENDLRGICAEAIVAGSNPYEALLKAGVIKNASEFFDDGNS
jgi:hypothetical protein